WNVASPSEACSGWGGCRARLRWIGFVRCRCTTLSHSGGWGWLVAPTISHGPRRLRSLQRLLVRFSVLLGDDEHGVADLDRAGHQGSGVMEWEVPPDPVFADVGQQPICHSPRYRVLDRIGTE